MSKDINYNPFHMVVSEDGSGIVPTVQHSTFDLAEAEAQRLASKHNCAFYIVKAVAVVAPQTFPTITTTLRDKE